MQLTEDQKKAIEDEFALWQTHHYCGKSKADRQKLGQFFTPPPLSIRMLEKFDTIVDKTILDPTVGAGGLIAAAVVAGADPKKVYGIELDPVVAAFARVRLAKLGVPRHHIHVGNALEAGSYDFSESKGTCRLSYSAKTKDIHVVIAKRSGDIRVDQIFSLCDKGSITKFHSLMSKTISKEIEIIEGEHLLTKLGPVFAKVGLDEL